MAFSQPPGEERGGGGGGMAIEVPYFAAVLNFHGIFLYVLFHDLGLWKTQHPARLSLQVVLSQRAQVRHLLQEVHVETWAPAPKFLQSALGDTCSMAYARGPHICLAEKQVRFDWPRRCLDGPRLLVVRIQAAGVHVLLFQIF